MTNVVQFKPKQKDPINDHISDLEEAEFTSSEILSDIVDYMIEIGYPIHETPQCAAEMIVISEAIQSMGLRSIGQPHQLQQLVGSVTSNLDLNMLHESYFNSHGN